MLIEQVRYGLGLRAEFMMVIDQIGDDAHTGRIDRHLGR